MDVLPVVLLLLAAFVLIRLVQVAIDPTAREHAPAAAGAPRGEVPRRSA